MEARSGAELDLPGAPAEVFGAVNELSTTAIEQIFFKKKSPTSKKAQSSKFFVNVHRVR
jgi:hypothetical protein